jgi:hypothetical protein
MSGETRVWRRAIRECEAAMREYRWWPRDLHFPRLTPKQVAMLAARSESIAKEAGKESVISYVNEQLRRFEAGEEMYG